MAGGQAWGLGWWGFGQEGRVEVRGVECAWEGVCVGEGRCDGGFQRARGPAALPGRRVL